MRNGLSRELFYDPPSSSCLKRQAALTISSVHEFQDNCGVQQTSRNLGKRPLARNLKFSPPKKVPMRPRRRKSALYNYIQQLREIWHHLRMGAKPNLQRKGSLMLVLSRENVRAKTTNHLIKLLKNLSVSIIEIKFQDVLLIYLRTQKHP